MMIVARVEMISVVSGVGRVVMMTARALAEMISVVSGVVRGVMMIVARVVMISVVSGVGRVVMMTARALAEMISVVSGVGRVVMMIVVRVVMISVVSGVGRVVMTSVANVVVRGVMMIVEHVASVLKTRHQRMLLSSVGPKYSPERAHANTARRSRLRLARIVKSE
jgi:hypothetical protein